MDFLDLTDDALELILLKLVAAKDIIAAAGEYTPLALRCVAALASSTTQSVARHRPTASSALMSFQRLSAC